MLRVLRSTLASQRGCHQSQYWHINCFEDQKHCTEFATAETSNPVEIPEERGWMCTVSQLIHRATQHSGSSFLPGWLYM